MPKSWGTVDTTGCAWNSAVSIALKDSCRVARQVVLQTKKEIDGISNVLRPHPSPWAERLTVDLWEEDVKYLNAVWLPRIGLESC